MDESVVPLTILVRAFVRNPSSCSHEYLSNKYRVTINPRTESPINSKFSYDFTVHITPIYNKNNKNIILSSSEVENNSFTVHSNNIVDSLKFYWILYGKRNEIEIEPLKSSSSIKGNGPYTWLD